MHTRLARRIAIDHLIAGGMLTKKAPPPKPPKPAEPTRQAIRRLVHAGRQPKQIADDLGLTVARVAGYMRQLGDIRYRPVDHTCPDCGLSFLRPCPVCLAQAAAGRPVRAEDPEDLPRSPLSQEGTD